jgi:chromosome segregation ATPase
MSATFAGGAGGRGTGGGHGRGGRQTTPERIRARPAEAINWSITRMASSRGDGAPPPVDHSQNVLAAVHRNLQQQFQDLGRQLQDCRESKRRATSIISERDQSLQSACLEIELSKFQRDLQELENLHRQARDTIKVRDEALKSSTQTIAALLKELATARQDITNITKTAAENPGGGARQTDKVLPGRYAPAVGQSSRS